MDASIKDLRRHLANAEEICDVLSNALEKNSEDAGVVLCLEAAKQEAQETLQKLKRAEREASPDSLKDEHGEFPRVKRLSDVETRSQLLGYYVTKGLKSIDDKIRALKEDMAILGVLGETEIVPEEHLHVLEDAVLFGYWKASYARTVC